ncbi:thymocyte selection-associated high mobility group box protein TOX-like [Arapaima gigas]
MELRSLLPPPPGASKTVSCCVGSLRGPGPDPANLWDSQFDRENVYLTPVEQRQNLAPQSQFSGPDHFIQMQDMKQLSNQWRRDGSLHVASARLSWTYPTPSLGNEDFNIPPITPPTLGANMEHGAVHSPCSSSLLQNGSNNLPLHDIGLSCVTLSSILSQDGRQQAESLSMVPPYSSQPNTEGMRLSIESVTVQPGHLVSANQVGVSGSHGPQSTSSSPGSKSMTTFPSSSVHDDKTEASKVNGVEKRPAADFGKKPKTSRKKKKRDPNEPQKAVSAYALFFRDTQAAIKGQNSSATFGEVSRTVASLWDKLGEVQKQSYKDKSEMAKKEYLKQLAAYRATLDSQSYNEQSEVKMTTTVSQPGSRTTSPGTYLGQAYLRPSGLSSQFFTAASTLSHSITSNPMATTSPLVQHQPAVVSSSPDKQQPHFLSSFLALEEREGLRTELSPVVVPPMDLVLRECSNPLGAGLDWTSSRNLQREKAVYLQ